MPLYLSKESNMSRVARAFKEGQSHMAIVLEDKEQAGLLRNLADRTHYKIEEASKKRGAPKDSLLELDGDEAGKLEGVQMIGILTLENVIERIMQVDIHDERDRDAALDLLKRHATIVYDRKESANTSIFQYKVKTAASKTLMSQSSNEVETGVYPS